MGIRLNTMIFCTSALAVLFLNTILRELFTGSKIEDIFSVFTLGFILTFVLIVEVFEDNSDDIVVDDIA